MQAVKRFIGPLYPIVCTALVMLIIFSCSRIGLSLWQLPRLVDEQQWYQVFSSGLRIDIASVCIYWVLPALVTSLITGAGKLNRCWQLALRLWIVLGLWLCVFMEVVTPAFIMEYDLRPNRLFVEYLRYPKEISSMLWAGYKAELAIACTVSLLCLILSWRWSRYVISRLTYHRWYIRPLVLILVLVILVAGARSTLGHRPLNPAMVAFSNDPLLNDLTLNSAYSVLFAAQQMRSEASAKDYYPALSDAEVIQQIQASMNVPSNSFTDSAMPTQARHLASYPGPPKNIVIVLLESHGARYVKSLGGVDVSPHLDALIQKGWAFDRMYATGTRSVRGIEAVTSGFSPTPARSVVKLSKSQSGFFTIANLLKFNNYHTQFIYGGESHFDNMKRFFLGNGFSDIQDLATFKKPRFVGSWGASDQDLFDKANRQFEQLSQADRPFFSLVFSSSNHSPFEYPQGVITPYNQPSQTVENAVKYADYALGEFVAKARASKYWDNTVFAVIADHDARTFGSSPLPISHFRIPAVIFGGGIEPRLDKRLVSQIDLAPTLLSLAGISSVNPMIGHDLTAQIPTAKQRAIMQRDKNFGWMNADNQVVIFQAGQGASTYQYEPVTDQLVQQSIAFSTLKRAQANALWGSLAFAKDYYKAQSSYALQGITAKLSAAKEASEKIEIPLKLTSMSSQRNVKE